MKTHPLKKWLEMQELFPSEKWGPLLLPLPLFKQKIILGKSSVSVHHQVSKINKFGQKIWSYIPFENLAFFGEYPLASVTVRKLTTLDIIG